MFVNTAAFWNVTPCFMQKCRNVGYISLPDYTGS